MIFVERKGYLPNVMYYSNGIYNVNVVMRVMGEH